MSSSSTARDGLVESDVKDEESPVESDVKDEESPLAEPVVFDENSSLRFCDSSSFVKTHALLVQTTVRGRRNSWYWQVSDEMKKICRCLVHIMKSQHSIGKILDGSLSSSHIWICSGTGKAQLRNISFTDKDFSLDKIKEDYKMLSEVIKEIIRMWGGDKSLSDLPDDFVGFLDYLEKDLLTNRDEFMAANHCALLPMSNMYVV